MFGTRGALIQFKRSHGLDLVSA